MPLVKYRIYELSARMITRCSIKSCACCTAMPSPEDPVDSW